MLTENPFSDKRYSKKGYLAILPGTLHKYEYLEGRVLPAMFSSIAHADLCGNVLVALMGGATASEKVRGSQTVVTVPAADAYFFPDVSVVIGKSPEYEAIDPIEILVNPTLIIEILSEGTAEYDRSEKFTAYRKLESFREYILIDSRKCAIETYYRESTDLWRIGSYYKVEQTLTVKSLGMEMPLSVIYAGVKFGDSGNGDN